MRTYGSDVRQARTLTQIYQDALTILFQDVADYAFIGAVAACGAGILVLALRITGGFIAAALIVPVAMLVAMLTLATCAEAFRRVVENLEPDGARAFAAVALRIGALMRPLVPLAGLMFVAVLGVTFAGERIPAIGAQAAGLALAAFAVFYLLPRSFATAILLTQNATSREAETASSALVWRSPGKIVAAWAVALSPALISFIVALDAGFGTLSTALTALLFVASMPHAAVVMMLLYFDVLAGMAKGQPATAPRRGHAPPRVPEALRRGQAQPTETRRSDELTTAQRAMAASRRRPRV
jgi:hypothetical protein